MRNLIYSIFLVITITSCNWIYKKGQDKQGLLDKEIARIDWNVVDEEPKLKTCDTLETNNLRKQCLYDFLFNTTSQRFQGDTITLNTIEKDTIWLALYSNPDSSLTVVPDLTNISDEITAQQLQNIISTNFDSLPNITPATKNGLNVKTKFNIPLVLNRK